MDHAWWQWDKLFGTDWGESTAARRMREQREQQRVLPAPNLPIRPAWRADRDEQEYIAYLAQQELLAMQQEREQREQQEWERACMSKADAEAGDACDAALSSDQNPSAAVHAVVQLTPPAVARLPQCAASPVPLSWLAASIAAAEAAQRAEAACPAGLPEAPSKHSRHASASSDVFEQAWSGDSSNDVLVFGDAAVHVSASQQEHCTPVAEQATASQRPAQNDVYTSSPGILRAAALKVLAQRRANARAAAAVAACLCDDSGMQAARAERCAFGQPKEGVAEVMVDAHSQQLSSRQASGEMVDALSVLLSSSSQYITPGSSSLFGSPNVAAARVPPHAVRSSLLANQQGSC